MIERQFGFVADKQKTIKENTRIALGNMQAWFYFQRPKNLAVHDLTKKIKPPPAFRSLLGLGLNFCIRPPTTTFNL
jgi:hypothetical protein